jgi:hypothetical protein
MSAMHSDVAVATILIKARERQRGNTYNELLKLLPELCTPVTTIVGLPTTTNVAWDGTPATATAGAPTSSSSPTQLAARASLDTRRNRGTPRSTLGACHARPRPHEGVLKCSRATQNT